MVEPQLPKLMMRVRFPLPAPNDWRFWLVPCLLLAALPGYFLGYDRIHALGLARYSELFGVAHVLFFFVLSSWLLALASVRALAWPRRAGTVLAVTLVIGAGIELLQPLAGRSIGLIDLARDLAGALLALLVAVRVQRPWLFGAAITGLVAVTCGGAVLVWVDRAHAFWSYPALSGFEQPLESSRWDRGRIVQGIAREGDASLRVELPPGRYPGVKMTRDIGDWRGWGRLELSLHAVAPLRVTVSIADSEHFRRGGAYGDRYDGHFALESGWNDLSIAIRDIECTSSGRRMDLDDLTRFMIFASNLDAPVTLHLDAIRLARSTNAATSCGAS